MGNASDPFELDDGFENIPVVQKPAQTVTKAANTVVKQTAQQVKATTKAFISQLYGAGTPSSGDDDQTDAAVDPSTMQQKAQTPQQPVSASQGAKTQQTPQTSDEEKLEAARRKLQQTHTSDYYVPTFGQIGSLESDIRKEADKRKQRDQEREQEEEQEKQKLVELEVKKKQEAPMAVKQAQTKSERRPGAG